jgi:hypothetical protein
VKRRMRRARRMTLPSMGINRSDYLVQKRLSLVG